MRRKQVSVTDTLTPSGSAYQSLGFFVALSRSSSDVTCGGSAPGPRASCSHHRAPVVAQFGRHDA